LERRNYEVLHDIWQIERFRTLSPFYLTRKRVIENLLRKNTNRKTTLIDIGCGIGDLISSLTPRPETIVGIDLSAQALESASRRCGTASFVLADARTLPIKAKSFDLAICSEVLEHLHSDSQAVEEISRVLDRGGIAVFTAPQNQKYWTNEDTFDRHLRRYDANDFLKMLHDHDFAVEDFLSWGWPLAFLFRRYFSSRIFDAGLHNNFAFGQTRLTRILAKCLAEVFRFDFLFKGMNLGLGIVAVARHSRT